MGDIKIERLREKIKAEAARVILTELNDPRAGFVTVQSVDLSRDLRHAKIFVSVLGEEPERRRVMRMLQDARGYIQRGVVGKLRTRVTPQIAIVLDTSVDKSFKVAAILDEIKRERGPAAALERSEGLEDSGTADAEAESTAVPGPKPKPKKKPVVASDGDDDDDDWDDDESGDDWDDEDESDDDADDEAG